MTSTLTQIAYPHPSIPRPKRMWWGVEEGKEKYKKGVIPSLWVSLGLTMKSAESQLLMSGNNSNNNPC